MENAMENEPLPLSSERAREILDNGHDGYSFDKDGLSYIDLLTTDEEIAVREYFSKHAKGYESFNSIIRKCAIEDDAQEMNTHNRYDPLYDGPIKYNGKHGVKTSTGIPNL